MRETKLKFMLIVQFCILSWSKSEQGYSVLDALTDLLKESDEHFKQQLVDRDLAEDEYDFIVVGAGAAGCVVASRLAEITEWKILLIEAGSDELFYMDIPANAVDLANTSIDWQYKTVPSNKYCLNSSNHQCNLPRGKVIGGSSILNYMAATRGNAQDYDDWAEQGNPGWEYKNVLPFFKKAENMSIPRLKNDNKYHHVGGPVTISELAYLSNPGDKILEAGQELGYEVGDYNGAKQSVFSLLQLTQEDGRRESTSRAYLYPAAHANSNLHIIKNALVTKLIFRNGAIDGVKYTKNNQMYITRARKEVILSAGAINSPQLLILSGIGPVEELNRLGVPEHKYLAVGYNLRDHVTFSSLKFVTNLRTNKQNPSENLKLYARKKQSNYAFVQGGYIFFFNSTNENDDLPNIEMIFSFLLPEAEQDTSGQILDISCALLKPKSKGRVWLKNANPFAKPIIEPNYFDKEEDIESLLRCVNKSFEIANTRVMKNINASFVNFNPIPTQCKEYETLNDDYWRCILRTLTETLHHLSGTCKMGPLNDKNSVVDSRLRIHGVQKLRVIDASIMPSIPAAHLYIPTIMIAEKGADMIKKDNGIV